MPIYDFKCPNCGHKFEKEKSIKSDTTKDICPKCNKEAVQEVTAPSAIIFKGSGFYCNDKNNT